MQMKLGRHLEAWYQSLSYGSVMQCQVDMYSRILFTKVQMFTRYVNLQIKLMVIIEIIDNWLLQVDTSPQKIKNVLLSTSDTLIWQAFASVIIPGFTINRICAAVQFAQRRSTSVVLRKPWIPTIVGLVSIPFIIHPIDHAVERTMDVTYRKCTGYHPKALLYETKHE